MAMSKPFWPAFNLRSGEAMPAIGCIIQEKSERNSILTLIDFALKAGYRSFEISALASNLSHIGDALQIYLPKHDLRREDIFITAKLYNAHHASSNRVVDAFKKTESTLQFTPDLYVLHFPPMDDTKPLNVKVQEQKHIAWSAVTSLYDSGRVMSVGLTNFNVEQFQVLRREHHADEPMLNQVQWNILDRDEELLQYCNQNGILLQGYDSLGGTNKDILLKHPLIKQIADDNAASSAQVLLTWSLQRGVGVIPKCTNGQHIDENINLNFRLTEEQMNFLNRFSHDHIKSYMRCYYERSMIVHHC